MRERHVSGLHEINDHLHLTLFSCCGNACLVDSIRHYRWLSLPVRAKKTADLDRARASANDHFHMILLLKGIDSWALAQLCVDHPQPAKLDDLAEVDVLAVQATTPK